MRKVINGVGQDTTTLALAYLSGNGRLFQATLYLIGEADDPNALWLTDWDTPLLWSWWGKFYPAVITRGAVTSEIGLKVATLDVNWSSSSTFFSPDVRLTSPYQRALMGKFDGATFRAWTAYMPAAGDVNTFGASELFGGQIGDTLVHRNEIKFTVNSFLAVVNQQVPGAVVENLNTVAGMYGATPPSGLTVVPTFTVTSGSTQGVIHADCLAPTPGQIFSTNAFQGGFLQFLTGSLSGTASAIITNFSISGPHNQFTLYGNFPWVPSVGDMFYASSTYPINQADGSYFGFPYVPDPNSL